MSAPELPPLRRYDMEMIERHGFMQPSESGEYCRNDDREARERILLARIAELEREADYWKMDGVHSCYDECPRIACVQRRQIAAREADAERYTWLRSRVPGGTYRIMGVIYSEGGAGVDAAIDAAREGK